MLRSLSVLDAALLLLAALGLLVTLPIMVYLAVALSLWAPPILLEDARAIPSLHRSRELTRGTRATLFGVTFVMDLLTRGRIGPASFALAFLRVSIVGFVLSLVSLPLFYAGNAPLGLCVCAVACHLILRERGIPVFR